VRACALAGARARGRAPWQVTAVRAKRFTLGYLLIRVPGVELPHWAEFELLYLASQAHGESGCARADIMCTSGGAGSALLL